MELWTIHSLIPTSDKTSEGEYGNLLIYQFFNLYSIHIRQNGTQMVDDAFP